MRLNVYNKANFIRKIEARPTRVRTSYARQRVPKGEAAEVPHVCLSKRSPGRGITSVGLSRLWSAIETVKAFVAAIELHHREKKFKAVIFVFLELRIKHQRA